MILSHNKEKGTVSLSPATNQEAELLARIVTEIGVDSGEKLPYAGRSGANPNDSHDNRMKLSFRLGSQKIELVASSDESEPAVRHLRDAIYFGGGGLFVVAATLENNNARSVDVCVAFCQHCNAPLVDMARAEWKTCEACVAKCAHNYEHGALHGGKAEILSEGSFCSICGRGKPDDEPVILVSHANPGQLYVLS